MSYVFDAKRYDGAQFRRCGLSGIVLPPVSRGLLQNFGGVYVGISSYSPERTREAAQILKSEGVPLLIHQPSHSMLNRWVEKELLGTLEELGVGCIAFSPLAQGLLTNKYLNGVPENSRAKAEGSFQKDFLSEENLKRVRR